MKQNTKNTAVLSITLLSAYLVSLANVPQSMSNARQVLHAKHAQAERHELVCKSPVYVTGRIIHNYDLWGVRYAECAPIVSPSLPVDDIAVIIDTLPSDDVIIVIVDDNHNNKQKKHCNKGEGNGGEGCDPGNHPEKGNNDEDSKSNRKGKDK